MRRDHLLIWLFIAASVVVDLALMVGPNRSGDTLAVLKGLVLGQVAELAIWAARGQAHRLARGATLVCATTGLALVTAAAIRLPMAEWLAQLSAMALAVLLTALVVDGLLNRRRAAEQGVQQKNLQFPLIELFGWTIVVAVVSFAGRHMIFDFLRRSPYTWRTVAAYLLVPLTVAALSTDRLRLPVWLKQALVVVSLVVSLWLVRPRATWGPQDAVILGLSGYCFVWTAIHHLDAFAAKPTVDDEPTEPPAAES
jgi:hypothetical protein